MFIQYWHCLNQTTVPLQAGGEAFRHPFLRTMLGSTPKVRPLFKQTHRVQRQPCGAIVACSDVPGTSTSCGNSSVPAGGQRR